MLAEHVPGWPDVPTYCDKLGPSARKAHNPGSLVERGDMLRPTNPRPGGETIYIAAWPVWAWASDEVLACLAAAAQRKATVVVLETGRRIEPTAGPVELHAAVEEFRRAKRREFQGDARKAAAAARVAKLRAEIEARVDLIREDWNRPSTEIGTRELLLRAGRKRKRERHITPMSYQTAAAILGPRPIRQKSRAAGIKRAEKRRAKAA